MDVFSRKTLQFDRFCLDLTRGALRIGNREIFPRPKVFGVLCHLAENAGRLVGKQELFEAVWQGIQVTDDSLVQCIRELRRITGDDQHRLIRTVARRGYLLDAEVRAVGAGHTPAVPVAFRPAPLSRTRLFSDADARRVEEIARRKKLPLPEFEIGTVEQDVPLAIKRFVGVWVSTTGFLGTNRQFMFIVTQVEREGLAAGYTVRGPPAPNSVIQNPAEAVRFTAFIDGKMLAYDNPRGHYRVWFARGNSLVFAQTYPTGVTTMVALSPVWTLREAERMETRRPRKTMRTSRRR